MSPHPRDWHAPCEHHSDDTAEAPDDHGEDRVLADLGREVRDQLMLILGATRRLLNSTPLTTTQQADLRTIQRSGNALLDLVTPRRPEVRAPEPRRPQDD
jgi:hypothetical protein